MHFKQSKIPLSDLVTGLRRVGYTFNNRRIPVWKRNSCIDVPTMRSLKPSERSAQKGLTMKLSNLINKELAFMTELRNQIKDLMASHNNDERKWSDYTLEQAANAMHDFVAAQVTPLTQQITDLQNQLKTGTTDQALADRVTALETANTDTQTQLSDVSGAFQDFITAVENAQSPADVVAALQAAASATQAAAPAVAQQATDSAANIADANPTGGTAGGATS